jgi:hypothetical protein
MIVTSLPCLGEKVCNSTSEWTSRNLPHFERLPFPTHNDPLYSKPMTFVFPFFTKFWKMTIMHFEILLMAKKKKLKLWNSNQKE